MQQDHGLFHDKFSSAVHCDGVSTAVCAAHLFCHCLHLPAGRHSRNSLSCKYTCAKDKKNTQQNLHGSNLCCSTQIKKGVGVL